MLRWIFAFVTGLGLLVQVAQAEVQYQDDRSSAAALVRSLYNAINRHEYARAFDYFSTPPAKTYESYQAGFADTDQVDVLVGNVSSDGAAGSVYYSVPTAIKSRDSKGNAKYFAGCYTVRAVNGSIQEPPYRPLQIEKGVLKVIQKDDFVSYSLPKCGEQPEQNSDGPSVDKAKALFASEQVSNCAKANDTLAGINEPSIYTLKYRKEGSDQDTVTTLYAFSCELYAYNESWVFYIYDSTEGLRLLSFAEPHIVTTHPVADDEGAKLESIKVAGFRSSTTLINAEFDEKTQTITSFDKWRGVGDSSSNGAWHFDNGEFVLMDYDVDPTFNGEIDPITVLKDGKLQKLP